MKIINTDTGYLFETAFDLSPAPIVLSDEDFNVLKVNRAFLQAFAGVNTNFKGKHLFKVVGLERDEAEQLRTYFDSNSKDPQNNQYEAFLPAGPNGGMWAIINNRKIDFQGQHLNIATLSDITILKKASESQKLNFQKAQDVFANTDDLVFVSVPDGSLQYVNQKWLNILGYTQPESEHLNITDMLQDDQVPQYFTHLSKVYQGQKSPNFETIFKDKNGKSVYVEGYIYPRFENERCVASRAIFRDISKRKAMEETYSNLIRSFPVSMYIIHDGTLRFANPSMLTLTGYTAAELIGKSAFTFIHPEDVPLVQKTASRLASAGKSISYEFRIITKSGEVRWVMETIIYIPYENSRAILGTLVDISERRFVEEALNESKNRYQTLFNSASDAIIIHDLEGNILEVNAAACSMLKYTRSELLKMNMTNLRPPSAKLTASEYIGKLLENGCYNRELEHLAKDGKTVPMEVHGILIEYERRKAVLNVARDISERRKAESLSKRYAIRLESQLKINEFKSEHSEDLLYFTLVEALKITESEIGYLYYFNPDKNEFSMNSWSKDLMKIAGKYSGKSTFAAGAKDLSERPSTCGHPYLKTRFRTPI